MRIDTRDLRRHYESMPDEELLAIDSAELTDAAATIYQEEIARRGLTADHTPADDLEDAPLEQADHVGDFEPEWDSDTGPAPEWLEDGVCVCAFAAHAPAGYVSRAEAAATVLQSAGIPCHVVTAQDDAGVAERSPQPVLRVMVPPGHYLHASSILDRDLFNEEREAEWRTHMEALSDDDLRALDPNVFCAGYLDHIARIRRAYEDEMERRHLQRRRR